jgi:hypothetical protein
VKTLKVGVLRSRFGKMPLILYLVEIVLAYCLSANLYTFSLELGSGMDKDTFDSMVKGLYILLSTIVSTLLCIRSMLTLPSAKKRAWNTTVRTLIIQMAIILFDESQGIWRAKLIESEIPVAIVCFVCIIIMMLPSIREFYTPPRVNLPKLKYWIIGLVHDKLDIRKNKYRFTYDVPATQCDTQDDVDNNGDTQGS